MENKKEVGNSLLTKYYKDRWDSLVKKIQIDKEKRDRDYDQKWLDKYHDLILEGMDSDDAEEEAQNCLEEDDEILKEEFQDSFCSSCYGTGEGMYDCAPCFVCNGSGN